jgi:hypothetical protein
VKLNREKFVADLKQLEKELRDHKKYMKENYGAYLQSHQGPDSACQVRYQPYYGKFFELRARTTRMYCLRAMLRGRVHKVVSGCMLRPTTKGFYIACLTESRYVPDMDFKARQESLVDSEPGWKEQYLLPEPELSAGDKVLRSLSVVSF